MQLLCVGDIALANKDQTDGVWRPPLDPIKDSETRILFNWELPVGKAINPQPRVRGPRLLSYPDSPSTIQKWAPGFATLATNHMLDAGEKGLVDTIESLERAGFVTVGAGLNGNQITRPLVWEASKGRLSIINWVFPETHPDWMAIPGPNCWPGLDDAKNIIRDLKRYSDWVLVVAHWSDELFGYPRPEDRTIARELAQSGADLIIGHHPHVVRGMEIFGCCPVFYSIGNFFFSDFVDKRNGSVTQEAPRNREGLGVQIDFQKEKPPTIQILSFWNTREMAVLDPVRRAERRLRTVSRSLRKLSGNEYAEWYAQERARFDKWGSRWHFGVLRWGITGSIQRVFSKLFSQSKSVLDFEE